MFCKYCQSLDIDAADSIRGAPHHESFADLVASADNGCELCKWVADYVRKEDPESFQKYMHRSERVTCSYDSQDSSLRWQIGRHVEGLIASPLYICAAKARPCCLTDAISSDDPMSKIVRCRPVCCGVGSEILFTQLRKWINACSSKHSSCQPRGRSQLPTRVIDVGRKSGRSLSLFTSNGQCGQWVTLSYCWGNKLPLRLVSSNLETFQSGIPLELLPPLFQDAITVARRLGHRYLWIDALCIIQDSEADWLNESAKMGEVFQNAALTILAESAEDSSVGLFSSMEQERWAPSIVIQAHSQSNGVQGYLCAGIEPRSRDGPLSGRAWTLQEELLSPCVIRFTESQVWWQCREAFRCETYPDSLREDADRQEWHYTNLTSKLNKVLFKPHHRDVLPSLLQSWYMIVDTYCGRKSTYVKDTFPAISGIAREYCRQGLQNYKAGLWLEDMHRGLLWTASSTSRKTQTPYVAPSWSWASMDLGGYIGVPNYDTTLIREVIASPLLHVASIESVNVALLSEDPFGQIKAANLVMTGPSIQICRNDVPREFMDIRNGKEDYHYSYSTLTTPRENQEYDLHWSLRKTATCNIWTVESVTRESPHPRQDSCLLLHVASHQERPDWKNRPQPRHAFCLILEAIPDDEEEQTSEQNESIDMNDQSNRSRVGKAKKRDTQTQHLDIYSGKKTVQYRRIGLAILQETVPTHTIWSEKTVTII